MGKPGPARVGLFTVEYIGRERQTRGSETSQYPEEKKTQVIP
jgi:hypothetical protein